MAKKYLTLDEAADASGLSVDELKRLREKGDLRGFADRGTWKFRKEEIEELRRSHQDDSSPEVPLFGDEAEDSSSVLNDDELALAEGSDGDSDSDVRLVTEPEESQEAGSDSDVKLVDADSGSGVQLVPELGGEDDSDSDVKLITEGSDSDVQLLVGDDDRSHSDVAVVAVTDSGLPVDLSDDTDEDQPLLSSESSQDSPEALSADLSADSGVSLENADDSGIPLVADDSGITLENLADSGTALNDNLLAADESGISLESDEKKHKTQGQTTVPMLEIPDLDDDLDETQLEIPSLDSDDESDFDLVMDKDTGSSDADVIYFEEDEADDHSATAVQMPDDNGDLADFDMMDDDFDEVGVAVEDGDLNVFDAVDEDFEESFEGDFESGESHPGFAAPGMRGQMAAPVESDWGTPTFVALIFSTALLSLCCMVMFDLVRSIWSTQDEGSEMSSWLLRMLSGMF